MPEEPDALAETRDGLLAAIRAFVEARHLIYEMPPQPLVGLTPPEFMDVLQVLMDASETAGHGTPEGERIWLMVRMLLHKLKTIAVTVEKE